MAKTNDQIKQEILDNITPNGNQEITGPILKSVLDDMQDFSNENVSVSQNTSTGHTDITIGSTTIPVASVEDIQDANTQTEGVQYTTAITETGKHDTNISVRAGVTYLLKNIGEIQMNVYVVGDTSVVCHNLSPNQSAEFTPASSGILAMYSGSASSGTMGILVKRGIILEVESLQDDVDNLEERMSNEESKSTSINNKVDAITTIEHSVNILNPANIQTTKGYWRRNTETGLLEIGDKNNFRCAIVDITEGVDYIATATSFYTFNANNNGLAIGYANNSSSGAVAPVFDTDNRVNGWASETEPITKLYLSWNVNYYPTNTMMVCQGTTLPPQYVPYIVQKYLANDIHVKPSQVEGLESIEVYTVKPSGGDYSTLTAALTALQGNNHPKLIEIYDGTYDVWQEIGGKAYADTLTSEDNWRDVSVIVPPNTTIRGIGNVILNFWPSVEQTTKIAASLLSCINVDSNVEIENITIICGNCRYGIHDETGSTDNYGTTHRYKNVRVFKKQISVGKSQAIGIGFIAHQLFEFDNCLFEASYHPMTFHNAGTNGGTDGTIINIKNCVLNAVNDQALMLGNVNGTQVEVLVNLCSCFIKNGILLYNASQTERPNAYNLSILNCNQPVVTVEPLTNIYEPQYYPPLS